MSEKETVGTVRVCPECGQSIESLQTRCRSCGHELNNIQVDESVKSFFQKLEELNKQEYEANKKREGAGGKKKRKQPKIVVLCEVVAVISVILMLLHLTPLPGMLRGGPPPDFSFDSGANFVEFIISNDSEYAQDAVITLVLKDGNMNPIEASRTLLEKDMEETLFFNNAGDYLVYIIDGADFDFFYPAAGSPVRMSGTIMLSFDGRRLVRYVERGGRIIFE
jgi:hypothetical protein